MKTMKLEIVTPAGVIYDGDIKQVTLPGEQGEFGVLPEHASLVSLLNAGVIDIETQGGKSVLVAINSGYVKIDENKALCIVDGAVALNDEEGEITSNIEAAKDLLKSAEVSSSTLAAAVNKLDSVGR
ncbi:MAG: F0F1 ATP synthase subunit epsilon [Sulfurovum sp.]|nr:F0F1 ATP synthase subunit epsilon [Sulfurovum sp.]